MANGSLIAIVEDDDRLRTAMDDLLSSCGYRTSRHASAESFIAANIMSDVECVVTDIQMDGMDGIALKEHIDARAPGTPVIMVTARAEEHLLRRAAATSPFRLLHKPFEPDVLIACVEQAVEQGGRP